MNIPVVTKYDQYGNLQAQRSPYTLNKKIIEWTRQFHGHNAALETPCFLLECREDKPRNVINYAQ